MKDFSDAERLAHVQAVLAHWDIPPVTSIDILREDRKRHSDRGADGETEG